MKKITLTCPFTGVEFDALENADGSLIVQHPLTGEHMRVGFNEPSNRYLLDRRKFEHIETVTPVEAAEILGVSKARISAITREMTIPHFTVNGKSVFLLDDIKAYSDTRSVGRPPKEG